MSLPLRQTSEHTPGKLGRTAPKGVPVTRHPTSWRLVPLSWLDLVTLACRTASTASEYFAADHADVAGFKAAEASGRIAATDADATPASVAEEILYVLVLSNGFTGHNRTIFLTDVLRAFA